MTEHTVAFFVWNSHKNKCNYIFKNQNYILLQSLTHTAAQQCPCTIVRCIMEQGREATVEQLNEHCVWNQTAVYFGLTYSS